MTLPKSYLEETVLGVERHSDGITDVSSTTPCDATPIRRISDILEATSGEIFISGVDVCPSSYQRSSKSFPNRTKTTSDSATFRSDLGRRIGIAFLSASGKLQTRTQSSPRNSGFSGNLMSTLWRNFREPNRTRFFSLSSRPKNASLAVAQPRSASQSGAPFPLGIDENFWQKSQHVWQAPRHLVRPILWLVMHTDLEI